MIFHMNGWFFFLRCEVTTYRCQVVVRSQHIYIIDTLNVGQSFALQNQFFHYWISIFSRTKPIQFLSNYKTWHIEQLCIKTTSSRYERLSWLEDVKPVKDERSRSVTEVCSKGKKVSFTVQTWNRSNLAVLTFLVERRYRFIFRLSIKFCTSSRAPVTSYVLWSGTEMSC